MTRSNRSLMKKTTVKVVSSFGVGKIEYDNETRILTVEALNHGRYEETLRYGGVEPEVFEEFTQAESKGGFFNKRIRNSYPYLSG